MPVAIDGGVVVQFGARRWRKGWQRSFGTKFDSVFDFRGIWVDVGVFWNDGTCDGTWVVEDERCRGEIGQLGAKVLPD